MQVLDKEARLQRVVSDLKSLEDQIRQADFAAKARRDAAEREFRERTEALEEVRTSSFLYIPLYFFVAKGLYERGPESIHAPTRADGFYTFVSLLIYPFHTFCTPYFPAHFAHARSPKRTAWQILRVSV